tara:strand:+ start:2461 stop:2883 length:423 start_codon:yes stop_codon:yes gene_type:complete
MDANYIINYLKLTEHPEGGWFKETFQSKETSNGRSNSSLIYYLLKENENSHWHRVTDADEIWLWHLGDPLLLSYSDEQASKEITLGPDLKNNEKLQAVIPKSVWQKAKSKGAWSLVSCVVAPAFSFDGFEMAKKGWEPKT